MKRGRMAAVVLNHRTAEDTYRAASSLMASDRRPDHLIGVDNDAADECRAHFAEAGAQSLTPEAPSPGSRAPSPESRVPSPESRVPSPESRVPSADVTYLHTGRNLG